MRYFARYKWFWLTLGLWFTVGTFSAWALIFSPFHLNLTTISEFSATVNGVEQIDRIFVSHTSPATDIGALTKEWQETGWVSASGGINLVNVILGTPSDQRPTIDRLAQLRLFRRKDRIRLLGTLAAQGGQTYHWVSEMPTRAIERPDTTTIDLPLQPPMEATDIATVKMGGIQAIVFTIPNSFDFHSLYLEQGFSSRDLPGHRDQEAYLLQKGGMKMMAVVEKTHGQSRVSLMELTTH